MGCDINWWAHGAVQLNYPNDRKPMKLSAYQVNTCNKREEIEEKRQKKENKTEKKRKEVTTLEFFPEFFRVFFIDNNKISMDT